MNGSEAIVRHVLVICDRVAGGAAQGNPRLNPSRYACFAHGTRSTTICTDPRCKTDPFPPIRDLELLKGAYWSYLEFDFDMNQLSEGNVWKPFLGLLHIG